MINFREHIRNICRYISKNALFFYILIVFFITVTTNPNFTMYNTDELHAYCIAKRFGFVDIIRLMRAEGHTFIWYMLLKLIPNTPLCFPAGIKWLSFSFSYAAIILLLFAGPFSKIEKILITYTFPMISLYPILARPYSLSILMLFILTILYKKRLEHPILFASLIFITANTSLMATVGAFTFSIVFLYDLIKSKNKNSFYAILILIGCAIMLYIQWHNPIIPQYKFYGIRLDQFLLEEYSHSFIFFNPLSKIIFPLFFVVSTLFLKSNPRNLFLFWSNTLLLIFIFLFVYMGASHHRYFLYIYWIISYWIQLADGIKTKYNKVFVIYFIIINILFNTYNRSNDFWFKNYNRYENIIELLNESIPKGSILYSSIYLNEYFYIFKNKMNFELKNCYNGTDLFDFDNYLNIYNFKEQILNIEKLKNICKKNSYVLISEEDSKIFKNLKNASFVMSYTNPRGYRFTLIKIGSK